MMSSHTPGPSAPELLAERDALNAEMEAAADMTGCRIHTREGVAADLAVSIAKLKHQHDVLKARVEELEREVALGDTIIAERNRVLDALPCPLHGQCVPHALDTIKSLREAARLLKDIAGYANLMIQSRELQRTEGANSSVAEYALEENERAAFASIKALLRDPPNAELVKGLSDA